MKRLGLSLIFAVLVIGSLLSVLFVSRTVKAHTITVDGDPSDWTGTAPTTAPDTAYSAGEFIVTDPSGDHRTDSYWDGAGTYTDPVDILEFRITSDSNYLYFLIKVAGLDTDVASNAKYVPCIIITFNETTYNTQAGRYLWKPDLKEDASSAGGTTPEARTNDMNWTCEFYINFGASETKVCVFNYTGSYVYTGQVATNAGSGASPGYIEAAVPLSALPTTLPDGTPFDIRNTHQRIRVASFVNRDGGINDDSYSNVRDVAGQTPTWPDEISETDDSIDTYFDVYFNATPEPVFEMPLWFAPIGFLAAVAITGVLSKRWLPRKP